MRKLTEEQVLSIPLLVEKNGGSLGPVALELGVDVRTVSRWINLLRMRKIEVKTRLGPKPTLK